MALLHLSAIVKIPVLNSLTGRVKDNGKNFTLSSGKSTRIIFTLAFMVIVLNKIKKAS
jgi:hypothetical protein